MVCLALHTKAQKVVDIRYQFKYREECNKPPSYSQKQPQLVLHSVSEHVRMFLRLTDAIYLLNTVFIHLGQNALLGKTNTTNHGLRARVCVYVNLPDTPPKTAWAATRKRHWEAKSNAYLCATATGARGEAKRTVQDDISPCQYSTQYGSEKKGTKVSLQTKTLFWLVQESSPVTSRVSYLLLLCATTAAAAATAAVRSITTGSI